MLYFHVSSSVRGYRYNFILPGIRQKNIALKRAEEIMKFEVKTIPPGMKRGWKVEIDGDEKTVSHIKLTSQYGTLSYGLRSDGFDGWAWREIGGGGAFTLPFTFDSAGRLLVGLLPEERPNMGEEGTTLLCIVGGFVDPGETHNQAQDHEAGEEVGLDGLLSEEIPGLPLNGNRLFFVADPYRDEGGRAWAMQIPFAWLLSRDGYRYHMTELPVTLRARLGKAANVVFLPWIQAIQATADQIAVAAIGRLVAMLVERGNVL